jgi:stage IV sporulation protein FB
VNENILLYLAAILLHEIFHIIAARVLFREKLGIVFLPTGFVGRWKNFQPEKWKQCIIFAFGPFGNFLSAAFIAVIPLQWNDKVELVRANLIIGAFNLIPLYPMDGGSILLVLLYNRVGSNRAYKIMKKISGTVKIILQIMGLYILIFHNNFSMVACIILLPGIASIKKAVESLNLNSLIRRKQRFLKRKFYEMRSILIYKNVSLGDALLLLDYDRYHIIHIADDNLNILCQVSEQQVINAMLEHNVGTTLDEVFIKNQKESV